MQVLPPIHTSESTAYLITDYPYGRLRCQKRVWLETNGKKGTRLVSRTSNPKRNQDWNNASKAGVYHDFAVLFIDDIGHVQLEALSPYDYREKGRAWLVANGAGLSDQARAKLAERVTLAENFEVALNEAGKPDYGTPAYKAAYLAACARLEREGVRP